jgi:chromosome segregation ATPase
VNPEDAAAGRFKEIRQARERIAKAEAVRAESLARLEELRGQIGPAEWRDREALGQALVDGKPAPASEAEKLKAELAQAERNYEAVLQAVQDASEQIGRLVRDNRERWRAKRYASGRRRRAVSKKQSPSSKLRGRHSPTSRRWPTGF